MYIYEKQKYNDYLSINYNKIPAAMTNIIL